MCMNFGGARVGAGGHLNNFAPKRKNPLRVICTLVAYIASLPYNVRVFTYIDWPITIRPLGSRLDRSLARMYTSQQRGWAVFSLWSTHWCVGVCMCNKSVLNSFLHSHCFFHVSVCRCASLSLLHTPLLCLLS